MTLTSTPSYELVPASAKADGRCKVGVDVKVIQTPLSIFTWITTNEIYYAASE
jgi:hypothetical protein